MKSSYGGKILTKQPSSRLQPPLCREDNEGDESKVGKQRPRHPLKVGDGSPCLWVTACPILLLSPHPAACVIIIISEALKPKCLVCVCPQGTRCEQCPGTAPEGKWEPWEAVPSACPCSHSILSMTLFCSTQFHVGVCLPGWRLSAERVWEGVLAATLAAQGDSRMAGERFKTPVSGVN